MKQAAKPYFFTITGEWLMEHARSLWKDSPTPSLAIRTLLEGLNGISLAQVLDVLSGKAKLTGQNDSIDLTEDSEAGLPDVVKVLQDLEKERDELHEDVRGLEDIINGDTVIVASPGGARKVPRRWCVQNSNKAWVLRKGWHWGEMEGVEDVEPPPEGSKQVRRYQDYEPTTFGGGLSQIGKAIEAVPPREKPQGVDEIQGFNGWLSPEGKFYACEYAGHADLIADLELPSVSDSSVAAEKLGWVKISRGEIFGFLWDRDEGGRAKPTERQKTMIRDWCLINHKDLPHWAEE